MLSDNNLVKSTIKKLSLKFLLVIKASCFIQRTFEWVSYACFYYRSKVFNLFIVNNALIIKLIYCQCTNYPILLRPLKRGCT